MFVQRIGQTFGQFDHFFQINTTIKTSDRLFMKTIPKSPDFELLLWSKCLLNWIKKFNQK
jgi:hypothetical protein